MIFLYYNITTTRYCNIQEFNLINIQKEGYFLRIKPDCYAGLKFVLEHIKILKL